jgi:hypothetical protein
MINNMHGMQYGTVTDETIWATLICIEISLYFPFKLRRRALTGDYLAKGIMLLVTRPLAICVIGLLLIWSGVSSPIETLRARFLYRYFNMYYGDAFNCVDLEIAYNVVMALICFSGYVWFIPELNLRRAKLLFILAASLLWLPILSLAFCLFPAECGI